jgi:hypothetical protein
MSHNSNIIRNKDETTTMRWNAASSTPSTYDTKNTTRSEEQCGFVIHVTVVLLSLSYTIWILQFYMDPYVAGSSGTPQTAPQQQQLSLSPPAWTVVLPTLLVVLFWAAPVAYGFVNAGQAAAAVSQKRQTLAMTVLQDGTTRVAPPLYTAVPKQRGHKTSDNGHTNTMQEYLQRPLETVSAASATTTAGSRHQGLGVAVPRYDDNNDQIIHGNGALTFKSFRKFVQWNLHLILLYYQCTSIQVDTKLLQSGTMLFF